MRTGSGSGCVIRINLVHVGRTRYVAERIVGGQDPQEVPIGIQYRYEGPVGELRYGRGGNIRPLVECRLRCRQPEGRGLLPGRLLRWTLPRRLSFASLLLVGRS